MTTQLPNNIVSTTEIVETRDKETYNRANVDGCGLIRRLHDQMKERK